MITANRNDTDITKVNRITITRNQRWDEKQLCGHFKRLKNNTLHEKTRMRRKGILNRETESLLIAVQKKNQSYQNENILDPIK